LQQVLQHVFQENRNAVSVSIRYFRYCPLRRIANAAASAQFDYAARARILIGELLDQSARLAADAIDREYYDLHVVDRNRGIETRVKSPIFLKPGSPSLRDASSLPRSFGDAATRLIALLSRLSVGSPCKLHD
jgi:hypothetical protein